MHKEKVVHAYIDCQICKRVITQYLNEPKAFEVIRDNNGPTIDACLNCADKYYEKDMSASK